MKNIKIVMLIAIALCATTFAQAQEIKAEVRKTTAVKPPAPPADVNKPSPASVFKPMDGIAAKEAPAAATQTPSPAADKQPAPKPIVAVPIQDMQQNPNNAIPQPGVLKKHIQ